MVILLNLIGWSTLGFLGYKLNGDAIQVVTAYQELYTIARGKEDLRTITGAITETAESRAAIAAAWLRGEDLILFIKKLENLAKTAGVEFRLDEPKPIAGETARLDLSFRASGLFAGLYHFLALLENLPYRLDWRGVTWSFESGTTWSGDFNLAVTSYTDTNVIP